MFHALQPRVMAGDLPRTVRVHALDAGIAKFSSE